MKVRTLRSAGIVLALLMTAGITSEPPAASAAGVTVLRPGDDVGAALAALRPGDTLRLAPGIYGLGLGLTAASGTPSQPITVTALNPSSPPLLRGSLTLRSPNYWRLSHLRFQATVGQREALTIKGGVGWVISRSEFFGAAQTGAYANVAISNFDIADPTTAPRNWQFTFNCVHDAGRGLVEGHNSSTDHNLYVNASGNTSGLIARNVMFNAHSGGNIKVGNGGDARAPGPSNVRIEYNTLSDAGRQVLIFGNLTGTRVWGNLLVRSTAGNARVGVYLNTLSRPGSAVVGTNYGYLMDRNLYYPNSPSSTFKDLGNNVLGRSGANDPRMSGTGCSGLVPKNSSVLLRYGRTARLTN